MTKEKPIHLRFETATRYYMMRLEPDLFGDWTLLKVWGGKTNRLGQQRLDHCSSYADGITRMDEIQKRRLMRNYSARHFSPQH